MMIGLSTVWRLKCSLHLRSGVRFCISVGIYTDPFPPPQLETRVNRQLTRLPGYHLGLGTVPPHSSRVSTRRQKLQQRLDHVISHLLAKPILGLFIQISPPFLNVGLL